METRLNAGLDRGETAVDSLERVCDEDAVGLAARAYSKTILIIGYEKIFSMMHWGRRNS
jgi:hypothetical protein